MGQKLLNGKTRFGIFLCKAAFMFCYYKPYQITLY